MMLDKINSNKKIETKFEILKNKKGWNKKKTFIIL
jgi:hypothetical protein